MLRRLSGKARGLRILLGMERTSNTARQDGSTPKHREVFLREPLGLGLIGLGRHGQRYARHLLDRIPHCHLVAVCRRDTSRGRTFATQHGLRFYHDYHDLIADPEIQAIIVVTPPGEAFPITLEAIRQKKPLLVEKPLAHTAFEAQQIVQAAAQAKSPVMVAQTLRYEETIVALKQHGSKIGQWQYIVLTNRLESALDPVHALHSTPKQGALLEIGIHQLDLVRFLTGQEVQQVHCDMDREDGQGPDTRAWVTLKTDGDIPCLLDISRQSTTRVTRAEIIGKRGQLIADWTSNFLTHIQEGEHTISQPIPSTETIPKVIADFVNAVQNDRPMPITGLDGQRAVEIADACYESARTGKVIHLKQG